MILTRRQQLRLAQVLAAVDAEVRRAFEIHPSHRHRMLGALIEEVGEVGKALIEDQFEEVVEAELVQVAAVAVRICVEDVGIRYCCGFPEREGCASNER